MNVLKRFQRREMLRVAARDLFGMLNRESLTTTTTQLSNLADTIVDRTLHIAAAEAAARQGPLPGRFAVIGMGKLGGGDLNYSSDIDLIYVYDASAEEAPVRPTDATRSSDGASPRCCPSTRERAICTASTCACGRWAAAARSSTP